MYACVCGDIILFILHIYIISTCHYAVELEGFESYALGEWLPNLMSL